MWLVGFVATCIAVVVGIITLQQREAAFYLTKEADMLLFTLTEPDKVLAKYQLAEQKWPVFRYDTEFQKQKQFAELFAVNGTVAIFFKNEVLPTEIKTLRLEISQMPGVYETRFISQEEAVKVYLERNNNSPLLTDLVTPDVLPASIHVYFTDKNQKEKVKSYAESKSFVEGVR